MSGGTLLVDGSRARRLYLQVGQQVEGYLHGEHLGMLPGSGGELAEARLYAPGDDVRKLDWAVLARTGVPHIRTTTAQRELETTFVVDLTPSMAFGTRQRDKRTLALTMVAAFCHLASGPGDRIGAVVLTTAGVQRVPSRTTGTAGPHLLSLLDRTLPGEGAAPSLALALQAVPTQRRGLVVLITDLVGPPDWQPTLRRLALRHDVIVVQVHDPRELDLPSVGLLRVVDPETGRALDVPTGSRRLRQRYAAAARSRHAEVAELVRTAGAAHLPLATDEDWLKALSRFLSVRRRVRAARRVAGR